MRTAVVIPCFNDGGYLASALASLEDQEPHELVIVDDGSSEPDTLATLDELRERGVRVVSKPNGGLGPARMTGVAETSAPYVYPLDADDRLAPGALEALGDALDADPEAAAAWGHYRSFGATDCFFPCASRLDPWRLTYFDEIPGTCMVRRTTFERYGSWEHVGYEDWDFWMRLAENGATGVGLDRTVLLYREHDDPRLFAQTLERHAHHWDVLQARHPALFAARPDNRRRSDSPRALKLLWPLIEGLPLVPALRRRQLLALARFYFQREMVSDCYRSPLQRLRPGR